MESGHYSRLWFRWVGANALGEMLGLGATFAALAFGMTYLGSIKGLAGILLSYGLAIVTGIIEASLVGWAQWRVLVTKLPRLRLRSWWAATLFGALIAYILGYLPSTIMGLQEEATKTAAVEPEQWLVLLLAAGLGLVGGLVLSYFQWRKLRRHLPSAWLWLPANMLGWMLGMPLIFLGIDSMFRLRGAGLQLVFIAGTLLLTGAIVGAVHGIALVRLVKHRDEIELQGLPTN